MRAARAEKPWIRATCLCHVLKLLFCASKDHKIDLQTHRNAPFIRLYSKDPDHDLARHRTLVKGALRPCVLNKARLLEGSLCLSSERAAGAVQVAAMV